jgi:hypothetical protein
MLIGDSLDAHFGTKCGAVTPHKDSATCYLLDALDQAGAGVQADCIRSPQCTCKVRPAAAGCTLQGATSHRAQAARRWAPKACVDAGRSQKLYVQGKFSNHWNPWVVVSRFEGAYPIGSCHTATGGHWAVQRRHNTSGGPAPGTHHTAHSQVPNSARALCRRHCLSPSILQQVAGFAYRHASCMEPDVRVQHSTWSSSMDVATGVGK